MNANSDKDYIDARMEGIDARVDSRFADMNTNMNTKFAEMDIKFMDANMNVNAKFAKVDIKFAELRTEMAKGFADVIKWMIGTLIAMTALLIASLTFVVNVVIPHAAAAPVPASVPAPIIIQIPVPVAWSQAAPATPAPNKSRLNFQIIDQARRAQ